MGPQGTPPGTPLGPLLDPSKCMIPSNGSLTGPGPLQIRGLPEHLFARNAPEMDPFWDPFWTPFGTHSGPIIGPHPDPILDPGIGPFHLPYP